MPDRWSPGDKAMCIRGGGWTRNGKPVDGPAYGTISTVRSVGWDRQNVVGLWFYEWSPTDKMKDGFNAASFRKLRPLSDEERREALQPSPELENA